MTSTTNTIAPGRRVRLHLEIRLEDDTLALSTFGENPLDVIIGDGTFAPGLERKLTGLTAGADKHFSADGSDLYGPSLAEKLHWLSRDGFPSDPPLQPGQVISFDAPGGQETAGMVVALETDRVQIDFNHPLSGRTLRIHVLVLAVTDPADNREIH